MGNKSSLISINPNSVTNLPGKGVLTRCRVTNVHDGDTVTIMYLIGNKTPFKINLRMEGIDAPEITSKNTLEKEAGLAVTRWLKVKIAAQKYWWVLLKKWDKYGGRAVGMLYYSNFSDHEISLNAEMMDLGLVVPYNGGKKEEWAWEVLEKILKETAN